MNELKPCPFCGVMPIPQSGSVLYELHHKPNCFLGGRVRFGCYELERWNTRHDSELIATQLALKEAGEALKRSASEIECCSTFHSFSHNDKERIERNELMVANNKALSNPLTQQAMGNINPLAINQVL